MIYNDTFSSFQAYISFVIEELIMEDWRNDIHRMKWTISATRRHLTWTGTGLSPDLRSVLHVCNEYKMTLTSDNIYGIWNYHHNIAAGRQAVPISAGTGMLFFATTICRSALRSSQRKCKLNNVPSGKKQQKRETNQSRPSRGDIKFQWNFYLHSPPYVYGLVLKHLYQSKCI